MSSPSCAWLMRACGSKTRHSAPKARASGRGSRPRSPQSARICDGMVVMERFIPRYLKAMRRQRLDRCRGDRRNRRTQPWADSASPAASRSVRATPVVRSSQRPR
ncbi:conserved hypothetical protein [Ricinus communis]|uniref:Uncharacterized protein n=1 Tax=Ricinus communis TaxID=3988 RepID=B9TF97_RICCO|nr:conserved hypothetical protein [Ricinus communis]